jgi:hypothetical protein
MVIAVSLLVSLIGVLLYAFSSNPKIAEVGLVAYAAGLLAFLLGLPAAHIGVLAR